MPNYWRKVRITPSCIKGNSIEMSAWLERQWYRNGWWAYLLFPADMLMGAIVWMRRAAYRRGLLSSWHAPVPVVVIGNITVGGTGKTPLVLWLVDYLKAQGRSPGIISRGYGGNVRGVAQVTSMSNVGEVGDEPLLMARRGLCPVWIGRDRPAAARALLAAHPECDVLVSDDGLQHYALARDFEIVVVDGQRMYGNGALLPVGPLREPLSRLDSVDAVVINSGEADLWSDEYDMVLHGAVFHRLGNTAEIASAADFSGKQLHAIAGIGHPARFFNQLRSLGMEVVEHVFPDHHRFVPADLQIAGADAILMTEKDAVKCVAFAPENAWYLPVRAEVGGEFGVKVLEEITKVKDGR